MRLSIVFFKLSVIFLAQSFQINSIEITSKATYLQINYSVYCVSLNKEKNQSFLLLVIMLREERLVLSLL